MHKLRSNYTSSKEDLKHEKILRNHLKSSLNLKEMKGNVLGIQCDIAKDIMKVDPSTVCEEKETP